MIFINPGFVNISYEDKGLLPLTETVAEPPTRNMSVVAMRDKGRITVKSGAKDVLSDVNTTYLVKTNQEKMILAYYNWSLSWEDLLDFSDCEYRCKLSTDRTQSSEAAILLFEMTSPRRIEIPVLSPHQYTAYATYESPGYHFNQFQAEWDGKFNISMTYRRGSTITYSRYSRSVVQRKEPLEPIDYSAGKTKDLLAYVSNCDSRHYNRLQIIRELSANNLSLDLSGVCGKKHKVCRNLESFNECAAHKQYRFYLSFENSLCEDYITEKFWKVLSSDHYMIPVAMGGKSITDYTRVAPPHSFIHAEQFDNIDQLAQYLNEVAHNATLFNSYHTWRQDYKMERPDTQVPACQLCRVAHLKPDLTARTDFSTWWNKGACRTFYNNEWRMSK